MIVGIVLGAGMLVAGLFLIVFGTGFWPWFGSCIGLAGLMTVGITVFDEF